MLRISIAARRFGPVAVLCIAAALFGARPAAAAGVVGNGTPASCTEAAFDAALGGGGKVKFKCGANPFTLQLSNTKIIAVNTTIDGGNKITLTAAAHYPLEVSSSVTLKLKNINLKNSLGDVAGALRNYGTAKISNTTFENNRSDTFGGAIANYGSLELHDVQFTNNRAANGGGAIYNDGGTVIMYYGAFQNNQSLTGRGLGGAIANNAGAIGIFAAPFIGNQGHDGGAIYNNSSADFFTYYSDFTSNRAGYGGAVENNGDGTILIAKFKQNQTTADGGAVWMLSGELDISFASFDQNSAGSTGGAVSLYGGSAEFILVSFTHNHASEDGGGIYSTGDLHLENVTLSTNTTDSSGGGLSHGFGTLESYNVTVSDNVAAVGGGGIYGGGAFTSDIQNTVLSNNGTNCGGTVPSNDYNFSSDNTCTGFTKPNDKQNTNAFLLPLGNNGGMGQTHLPQLASPLLENGVAIDNVSTDERLVLRPQGGSTDIGALERCDFMPEHPKLTDPKNGATVPTLHAALEWGPGDCNAFYKVTLRRDSQNGTTVIQDNYVPLGQYPLPPLINNVTYYWRVNACNENGCQPSKWRHFTAQNGARAASANTPRAYPCTLLPAKFPCPIPTNLLPTRTR